MTKPTTKAQLSQCQQFLLGRGASYGVRLAQVAMRGDTVRLHAGMSPQPVADELVDSAVNTVECDFDQSPYLHDLRIG